MKIVVSEIPEEGLRIDDTETFSPDEGGVSASAVFSARAEKVGEEVRLAGQLKAEVDLECSRCLGPCSCKLDLPLDLVFIPAGGESGAEKQELADDELNTGFYREGELDVTDIMREQVLLNLPMKPLCTEECKGLCPKCGANLNKAACNCGAEVDERLQVLKKYFEKGKE